MECVSCVTIDLCHKWKKKPSLEFSIYCIPVLGQELLTCDSDLIQRNFFTLCLDPCVSGLLHCSQVGDEQCDHGEEYDQCGHYANGQCD